jgi:hypothetical protein
MRNGTRVNPPRWLAVLPKDVTCDALSMCRLCNRPVPKPRGSPHRAGLEHFATDLNTGCQSTPAYGGDLKAFSSPCLGQQLFMCSEKSIILRSSVSIVNESDAARQSFLSPSKNEKRMIFDRPFSLR